MRIGIDISQIVHEGTGVGKYVREMVQELISQDTKNEYILFGASLRKRDIFYTYYHSLSKNRSVTLKVFPIPPTVLDIVWNIFHVFPISWFIGNIDMFWSSDWTQPPLGNVIGMTTIHDLTIMRFPESFHKKILAVQLRRLAWVRKECAIVLCDSEATKEDCVRLLHIDTKKINVVYPGYKI